MIWVGVLASFQMAFKQFVVQYLDKVAWLLKFRFKTSFICFQLKEITLDFLKSKLFSAADYIVVL